MGVLAMASCVLAAVCGYNAWRVADELMRTSRYRGAIRALEVSGTGSRGARDVASGRGRSGVIGYLVTATRRCALRPVSPSVPPWLLKAPWFEEHAYVSGLGGRVSETGFAYARLHYAVLAGAAGFLLGFMVSVPLGFVGLGGGVAFGWTLPARAVKKRIRERAEELEHHLSEMLDVIAMGLRSGLSFDRSLELYIGHFDSLLVESLALAQTQWTHGLSTRDDALRAVAASYDSPLFSRVVENIIRSLRFGSSMASVLEEAARESRTEYQANRQEQVAKAPVKMMLPTGALILPAMLLLVLGPVMLELMGGL